MGSKLYIYERLRIVKFLYTARTSPSELASYIYPSCLSGADMIPLGGRALQSFAGSSGAERRKGDKFNFRGWSTRENVRAHLRVIVKRILRKHGYPPGKQGRATKIVLEQAQLLALDWAA